MDHTDCGPEAASSQLAEAHAAGQPSSTPADPQYLDELARAVRGELGDEANKIDHVEQLRRQAETIVAALLSSKREYLTVNSVDDVLKPSDTTSWGTRSKQARKEHVRKMADVGDAFI